MLSINSIASHAHITGSDSNPLTSMFSGLFDIRVPLRLILTTHVNLSWLIKAKEVSVSHGLSSIEDSNHDQFT